MKERVRQESETHLNEFRSRELLVAGDFFTTHAASNIAQKASNIFIPRNMRYRDLIALQWLI